MQQHAKVVQNTLEWAKMHGMCMEMYIVAWNVHKCTSNGLKCGKNEHNHVNGGKIIHNHGNWVGMYAN